MKYAYLTGSTLAAQSMGLDLFFMMLGINVLTYGMLCLAMASANFFATCSICLRAIKTPPVLYTTCIPDSLSASSQLKQKTDDWEP